MTQTLRLGFVLGLAIAVATAAWWLGATRLVLSSTGTAYPLADQAISALLTARVLVACAFLPQAASSKLAISVAVQSGLLLIAAAWPITALCWLAGGTAFASILLSELGLLVAIVGLVALGRMIRRSVGSEATASAVAGSLGLLLACAAWLSRDHWLLLGVQL